MSVLSLTFPRFDFTINELDIAGVPVLLLALCKRKPRSAPFSMTSFSLRSTSGCAKLPL